jgi:hypothetical protein
MRETEIMCVVEKNKNKNKGGAQGRVTCASASLDHIYRLKLEAEYEVDDLD